MASSAPTNGFLSAVSFTATLPAAATGTVLFQTNSVAISSATTVNPGAAGPLTTTGLVRGTNIITATYAGDANYFGSTNSVVQVVTNHPPVIYQSTTIYRSPGLSLKIPVSTMASNWSDADGDKLTMAAAVNTANGVALTSSSSWIFYSSTSNTNDSFSYSVSDGYGGTATSQVNIVTTPFQTGQSGGTLTIGNGNVVVQFAGIPGLTYEIQCATNVSSPSWVDIYTNTPSSTGVILFTNSLSAAPSAFYRLKWQQ